MKKAWKFILILALCILILGEVVLGVGLITGGSPERVWDAVNEHYHIDEIAASWNENVEKGTLKELGDLIGVEIPKIPVAKPTITTQPKDASGEKGDIAKFTVAADGSHLTYQWQWSYDDGKTWKDSTEKTEGYNEATLQVKVSKDRDGYLYRCVVTNSGGSVTTEPVKLTLKK